MIGVFRAPALLVLLFLLVADTLCAQEKPVRIPRVSQAPRLEDFEHMRPQGAGEALVKVSGFTQNKPSDGAPATEQTDVYLGYDRSHLYAVFVCFDDPGKVQGHMTAREDIMTDDFVELTVDTFHDQRHGFVFDTNPLGVQSDGLWNEPNNPDFTFDTVWDSRGKLTSQGFVVWMSIPFRSLRFPPGAEVSTWGFTLLRVIQRKNEWDFWPHVSSRVSGRLNQEGEMQGMKEISTGRNMQFNPYEMFRSFRTLDTTNPSYPAFVQSAAQSREGLDSKFIFHNRLVLDATVNPDFSQVESDQPQNTVNQRFAVFFPEKRPFFMENSNLFEQAPSQVQSPGGGPGGPSGGQGTNYLVFTRNIEDPEFGVRLTGMEGPYSMAFLATDDRGPGESVVAGDPAFGKRAYFGIAHVSREFGTQSTIGLIYTDREFLNGWNRVGGVDGSLKLNPNWTLAFRAVASSTRCAASNSETCVYANATTGAGPYSSAGPYYEATFNRLGRQFNYGLQYQDISPGFETRVGFVPRVDLRHVSQNISYLFRPEGKHLVSWGPEMHDEVYYDHNGTMIQYNLEGDWAFEMTRQTTFSPLYQLEVDTLRPKDFTGLDHNLTFARDGGGVNLSTQPWKQLQLTTRIIDQGGINVVPPTGQMPVLGNELSVNTIATLVPTGRLKIDNTYILDRLTANHGQNAAFNNHIFRSKWNYQITRALSVRVIGQYNNLLANPRYTSLQTTKDLSLDFLITYLVHPGTAVYVGYDSDLQNLDPGLCMRISSGACDPNYSGLLRTPNSFINDGRQFFVKVSYLFRP
jgi:hypothetical protein